MQASWGNSGAFLTGAVAQHSSASETQPTCLATAYHEQLAQSIKTEPLDEQDEALSVEFESNPGYSEYDHNYTAVGATLQGSTATESVSVNQDRTTSQYLSWPSVNRASTTATTVASDSVATMQSGSGLKSDNIAVKSGLSSYLTRTSATFLDATSSALADTLSSQYSQSREQASPSAATYSQVATTTGSTTDTAQTAVSANSIPYHKRLSECQDCGIKLPHFEFKRHILEHRNQFMCKRCSKTFATHMLLKVHQQRVHSGIKPYACDTCGKRFTESAKMRRHVSCVHLNLRPHPCGVCGRRFARRDYQIKHEKLGTCRARPLFRKK